MTSKPGPLMYENVSLREIAVSHGLEMVGHDRDLLRMALLKSEDANGAGVLTYVTSNEYLDLFISGSMEMAVVERRFASRLVRDDRSFLVAENGHVEDAFFEIHIDLGSRCRPRGVKEHRGTGLTIHESAVVMHDVQIGDDVTIGPHVTIYPNTVIGDRVTLRPNSSIGGEGFEVKRSYGRRTMIPHNGGVYLADDVLVGASTSVDRGLFGSFTSIGAGTKIDNLVYVAHNVEIGEDCSVIGQSAILGSSVLGRGVWYGPSSSCNHEIRIGDYAYIGTGSVLINDVPAFTMVAGSPARVLTTLCRCRTRQPIENGSTCPNCRTTFVVAGSSGRISIKRD